MLSYLKDPNQIPATAGENSSETKPAALSGPGDYLTVAGHGKKLRQSTILLGVLFVVGAAVVFFMIKKTSPAAASAAPDEDQLKLEAALVQIENMKKEMDTQMNTVVGRFYQFSNVNQIGVDELKKNPFQRELEVGPISQESDMAALSAQQQQRLLVEAQSQGSQLELWSITSTPKGMCCMIGDKVLYEGDSLGEMKVKSIQTKRVVLDYKGVPVELTIE